MAEPGLNSWLAANVRPFPLTGGATVEVPEVLARADVVGIASAVRTARESVLATGVLLRSLVEHAGFRAVFIEGTERTGPALDRYLHTGEGDLRALVRSSQSFLRAVDVEDVLPRPTAGLSGVGVRGHSRRSGRGAPARPAPGGRPHPGHRGAVATTTAAHTRDRPGLRPRPRPELPGGGGAARRQPGRRRAPAPPHPDHARDVRHRGQGRASSFSVGSTSRVVRSGAGLSSSAAITPTTAMDVESRKM